MTVTEKIENLKNIREGYKKAINIRLSDGKNFLRPIDILELKAVGLLVDLMVQRGYTLISNPSGFETSFVVCYDRRSETDEIHFLCQYARLEKDGVQYTIGGGSWQIFEGISITSNRKQIARFEFDLDDLGRSESMFLERLERNNW